jgi:hypothetical protein
MTTIAYRDGVLAADSLVTNGETKNGSTRKVFKLRDGRFGLYSDFAKSPGNWRGPVTARARNVSFGTKSLLGSLHLTHSPLPIFRWKRTGRRSIVDQKAIDCWLDCCVRVRSSEHSNPIRMLRSGAGRLLWLAPHMRKRVAPRSALVRSRPEGRPGHGYP